MRCPFCGTTEDRVVDSRESREGDVIRRRRECTACGRRFTSYEKIEQLPFQVIKRDQRREPYDRDKLMRGLQVACRKRAISQADLDRIADAIETAMQESGEREIASQNIGRSVRMMHRRVQRCELTQTSAPRTVQHAARHDLPSGLVLAAQSVRNLTRTGACANLQTRREASTATPIRSVAASSCL